MIRKMSWRKNGEGFCVEVVCWEDSEHENWALDLDQVFRRFPTFNVYAYLFPKHPMFAELSSWEKTEYGLRIGEFEPLDCLTLAKINLHSDGSISSVQVGNDYSHAWDLERLRGMGIDYREPIGLRDALLVMGRVFGDAERCFEALQRQAPVVEGEKQ